MNIPLMLLAFGLMVGVPLWMVLRRSEWHGKQEAGNMPAYLARRPALRAAAVRVPRPAGYEGRRSTRPLTGGANG
jgi:hypothetical protein